MGILYSKKTINKSKISCDGSLDVTLSLVASPNIIEDPVDIVLALDCSGSMADTPLNALKTAANAFVDIIYNNTDRTDNKITGESRIGIVSFSNIATQDVSLSIHTTSLKNAINALQATGLTNHEDAFIKASDLFKNDPSLNRKVIIMFTDGVTTVGDVPIPITTAAKLSGTIIYCIGLGTVDVSNLEKWASAPSSEYVAIAPDSAKLLELLKKIAEDISEPGATNIVINEFENPDFIITSINPPTKGMIFNETTTSFDWSINKLGVTDCDSTLFTEPCPTPSTAIMGSCVDSLAFVANDTVLQSEGVILEVDVTVKDVCPNKRVALAVLVTELDEQNNEYKRGIKTFTIPAHTASSCRDVLVKCIKYVLPEDLDVSGASTTSMCNTRRFNIRTISHYIDFDYDCCVKLYNSPPNKTLFS